MVLHTLYSKNVGWMFELTPTGPTRCSNVNLNPACCIQYCRIKLDQQIRPVLKRRKNCFATAWCSHLVMNKPFFYAARKKIKTSSLTRAESGDPGWSIIMLTAAGLAQSVERLTAAGRSEGRRFDSRDLVNTQGLGNEVMPLPCKRLELCVARTAK